MLVSPRASRVIGGLGLARWLGVILSGTPGRVGAVFVSVTAGLALLGPLIAPYSPTALGPPIQGPSIAHWLGTDQLGRDVLSRVLHGGPSVIALSACSVLLAFAVAGPLGVASGNAGGWSDQLLTHVAEVAMSVPPLLLALVFIGALGTSPVVLVGVVAAFFAPRIFRIVRGATQWVCTHDYVLAARARGESTVAIVMREILPNITGPLLAEFALRLNYAVIFIATLNFLGLGVQPPSSDWGLMVSEGRILLNSAPLVAMTPAVAIALLAVGVNLISDQIASHLARDLDQGARL